MALLHVDFYSEILKMSTQMDVILPQKTNGQVGMKKLDQTEKYPVLYLLHGMTDDHTTWQRRTSIERYAAERGMAVVMPACYLGWYTDMHHGYQYYTYVAEELPQICQYFFPRISQKREDTFIAGNSMGGYGAFKIALRNPDKFGAAASLSGAMDPADTFRKDKDDFSFSLFEDIFGTYETFCGSDDDVFAVSKKLAENKEKAPELYMWCGTEDYLYDHNTAMRDHLNKLGVSLTYRESPGNHSWKYWDHEIAEILDWFLNMKEK